MKTVLCIDDDPWVIETLKDALAPRGMRVFGTTSVEEAPHFLKQVKIDLILLDLSMPGKSGFQLYRELEAIAPVPVLFVSGCSRSFSANSAEFMSLYENEFLNGQTDILYKPFPLERLYDKVESLIGECVPA